MSPTLKQFYKELQNWIDSGFPDHSCFMQDLALCESLYQWNLKQNVVETIDELTAELEESFTLADLRHVYPFNNNRDEFIEEVENYTIYKNPARLAWIKEHTKD